MEWKHLETLLDELLDLPEPARAARMAELESLQPEAAEAVREALATGDAPGLERLDALVEALAGSSAESGEPEAPMPAAFGPWRPVERLGSGGMGEVWRVRRADGEYRATAALKRLHAGTLSPSLRERFLRERQLLADLRHPNIAALLDGGVDERGVPYFVLEYVDGRPIHEHCDAGRLPLATRLALFDQVCAAVGAAHQRLIVHRDLKPANILVTPAGEVKLVDFGIAKLLDEPADIAVTASWERVLTPRYAAPEQLEGGEVTTATDVFGLGVVLHELLCGLPPRAEKSLRSALRTGARLSDPPPMSVALARLAPEEEEDLAGRRSTTPRALRRALRGDLDEIVAKALRSAPDDRYPTVASLVEDLDRARRDEPVRARHGSRLYRARKFWARHRLAVTAAALVVVSLAVGLSVALVQRRAARLAERRAAAINRFLTDELLGSADPRVARGRDLTVREVVDHAGLTVGSAFGHEPDVEAALRRTLGTVSARLGEFQRAREQLAAARALVDRSGGDPLERARLARAFAELDFAEGRFSEARPEIAAAVAALTDRLGAEAGESLEARILAGRILTADGDVIEAEGSLRRLVAAVDALPEPQPVLAAAARVELAAALKAQGRRDDALAELLEAARLQEAALGPDHPDLAQTLEQQSHIYAWIRRFTEAEAAARRALAIDHRVFGSAHWRSVRGAGYLAEVLWRAGRVEEAGDIASAALAAASPDLGADHAEIINLRNTLANLATRRGDFADAERHYRAALAGAERGLGAGAELTQMIRRNLANFLAHHGDRAESLRLAREVRALGLSAAAGERPDPMNLANVSWFLATAELAEARDLDTALALANEAVAASRGRWYYPWVALSEVHSRRGELDAAIEAEQRAVALPDGLHLPGEDRYLVGLLERRGDVAGAERFVREQLARRRAVRAADDPLLGETRALLGRILLAAGRPAEAIVELRAALAQLDLRLPADHELRIPALSDLGAALAATGATAEAARALGRAREIAAAASGERVPEERRRIEERLQALGKAAASHPLTSSLPAAPGAASATPSP